MCVTANTKSEVKRCFLEFFDSHSTHIGEQFLHSETRKLAVALVARRLSWSNCNVDAMVACAVALFANLVGGSTIADEI